MFRPISIIAVFLLAAWAPRLAAAESEPAPNPSTRAETKVPPATVARYRQAKKHFEAGAYRDALAGFREVDRAFPSPNARLYIARSLQQLGDLPGAFEAMLRVVQLSTEKAATDPRYLETRDAAAAEREAMAAKIGRVTIAVTDPPGDLEVTLGARALKPEEIGRHLGVMPGETIVSARARGYLPFRRTVVLAAGEMVAIAINLTPVPPAKSPTDISSAPSTMDRDPSTKGSPALRTVGFITAGIGVAGAVTFAVAGVMANQKFAQLEAACGLAPCSDSSYTADIDKGKTLDLVANIGLGVGVAGLVAGTTMVLVGWPPTAKHGAEGERASAWQIDVGPDRTSLVYRQSF